MEIRVEKAGHLAVVSIDRPARRNALDLASMRLLADAASSAARDSEVRTILFTGSGGEAFCAGADLKEADRMRRDGKPYPQPMTGLERNLFELILEIPKPTIAALNGAAVGAGCELALACDVRIAAENAVVGLPEAKRGMGANFGSVLLPRLIARSHAFDMLYTGRLVDAKEAQSIGLVSRVLPSEGFAAAARDYGQQIARNAPLTLERYKQTAVKGWEMSVHSALRLDAGPDPYTSADREEGVLAFLEKRAPRWQGR